MTTVQAPTAPLPEHLTQKLSDPALLGRELVHAITNAINGHERSQQRALGPSEVGHSCARRLGYKLLDYDENPGDPNWKATVGTAVHAWLEDAMHADDRRWPTEPDRWLTEQTVECGSIAGQPLTGHCDLYDRVTGTVVDWKTVGPDQLRKYKTKGPGEQYRAQAHLYGRGWVRKGLPVERVAVMFLPRQGELRDSYFWTEPYDEQIALAALERVEGIALTVAALGDNALSVLPTADAYCRLCPYFKARSSDLTLGCPGDPGSTVNAQPDPDAPAFGWV